MISICKSSFLLIFEVSMLAGTFTSSKGRSVSTIIMIAWAEFDLLGELLAALNV
jgi:hypothetical protein